MAVALPDTDLAYLHFPTALQNVEHIMMLLRRRNLVGDRSVNGFGKPSAHHGSEKNSREAHDLVHHFSFREVNRRFLTAARFRVQGVFLPFPPGSQNSEPSPPFILCVTMHP